MNGQSLWTVRGNLLGYWVWRRQRNWSTVWAARRTDRIWAWTPTIYVRKSLNFIFSYIKLIFKHIGNVNTISVIILGHVNWVANWRLSDDSYGKVRREKPPIFSNESVVFSLQRSFVLHQLSQCKFNIDFDRRLHQRSDQCQWMSMFESTTILSD